MLLERVEAPGIAHVSYLVGDEATAVVVDPRRDVEVYVARATAAGCRITDIVETHRNEDYVIGSVELADRTGAAIWHADAQLPYRYGAPARPGQTWAVGRLTLEALATPGHTPGGLSYLLREAGGAPWVVFTGDTLFAGDVGRTDLVDAARSREMAALLHESLFGSLLALGDEVIVAPGHGAGSVCGATIADRPWTTVGLERHLNPMLRLTDRSAFVDAAGGVRERPPYFRRMEVLNVEGAPLLGALPVPPPLAPTEFAAAAERAVVVDTRWETAFAAGHVPGALSLWLEGLPLYAGWLLSDTVRYCSSSTATILPRRSAASSGSVTTISRASSPAACPRGTWPASERLGDDARCGGASAPRGARRRRPRTRRAHRCRGRGVAGRRRSAHRPRRAAGAGGRGAARPTHRPGLPRRSAFDDGGQHPARAGAR